MHWNRARLDTRFALLTLCFSLTVLVYSQLYAYVGDESFHLLAAQLIDAGKKPYIDFFYQHPPLFVYLMAGIMRLTTEGWRAAHAFSALSLAGAMLLTSSYAQSLYVETKQRRLVGFLTLILFGANCYVLIFGTTALPFGFCLLGLAAALRLSRSKTAAGLFFTGLCAGISSASSFLTLPAVLVFLVWLLKREKARALIFVAGIALAFIPLLILLIISPQQTIFDVVEYHLVYRPNMGWHFNLREIAAWFGSLQGAMLTLLALTALRFRKDDEVRLCGWLAFALAVVIGAARTTFAFYFLLITPFVAILAAVGATDMTERLAKRSKITIAFTIALYLVGLIGARFIWRWEATYLDYRGVQRMAAELEAHTPIHGEYFAFEAVYVAAHRIPASSLENRFNPHSQADRWLAEGRFDAVCIGSTDPRLNDPGLLSRYASKTEVNLSGYAWVVLWDRR
jgi:hypothetical protein